MEVIDVFLRCLKHLTIFQMMHLKIYMHESLTASGNFWTT